MRKRLVSQTGRGDDQRGWDLERVASVEITSEDAAHPIERALTYGGSGWRASAPGEQVIRLLFEEPKPVRRIGLLFEEDHQSRTQEFVLRWSADRGVSYREIVRQQFTFSPPGTTREAEDYGVALNGVTALELRLVPDISGGSAYASLKQMRLE